MPGSKRKANASYCSGRSSAIPPLALTSDLDAISAMIEPGGNDRYAIITFQLNSHLSSRNSKCSLNHDHLLIIRPKQCLDSDCYLEIKQNGNEVSTLCAILKKNHLEISSLKIALK